MADATFGTLVQEALGFFRDLRENNTREWFADQKKRYDASVQGPAKAFSGRMAEYLEAVTGEAHTPKIFRIHRDVRFAKDKTPYNTHLHLLWTSDAPGAWMLGLSPDYFRAGFGAMEWKGEALDRFRAAIAEDGSPLVAVIETLTGAGVDFGEPALKRVPAPYPKDHPAALHLRRKGLAGWVDLDPVAEDPEDAVKDAFAGLKPIHDAFRAAL